MKKNRSKIGHPFPEPTESNDCQNSSAELNRSDPSVDLYPSKKNWQKNLWNQKKIFSWNCIFGSLKLFPSSKIDFWPFLKSQKMEFSQKNFFFVKLIYLISRIIFDRTFLNFLARCGICKKKQEIWPGYMVLKKTDICCWYIRL